MALDPFVPPRALILAAGVGRRLGDGHPDGQHLPKALLRFGGRSLIARHLHLLRGGGITDITFVLGYGAAHIRAELATLGAPPAGVVINPDFRLGSVVSLHAGRDVLRSGAPVILMDADVLYDARLMSNRATSR